MPKNFAVAGLLLFCARWKSRFARLVGGKTDQMWWNLRMRLSGLDLAMVPLEKLGLSADRSVFYGNSGGPELKRVLDTLKISQGSRIVDFGCGKGGAILTFSKFPFDEIVGIDLSNDLIRIAEANMTRAVVKRVRFVHSDAADFTDLDGFTHIYMYHPFPCAVVKAVLGNLSHSLFRCERRLVLLYRNPVCHSTIVTSGLFRAADEFKFDKVPGDDTNLLRVYTHEVHGERSQNG